MGNEAQWWTIALGGIVGSLGGSIAYGLWLHKAFVAQASGGPILLDTEKAVNHRITLMCSFILAGLVLGLVVGFAGYETTLEPITIVAIALASGLSHSFLEKWLARI